MNHSPLLLSHFDPASPAMEKQAAQLFQLGKLFAGRLGKALWNANVKYGLSSGGKFLGRLMGAAPAKLGNRRGMWWDGTKVVGETDRNAIQRAGDWLWNKSDDISEWGVNKLDAFNKTQQEALRNAGKGWDRAGKVMGGVGAWMPEIGFAGSMAYPWLTGRDTPGWVDTALEAPYFGAMYLNPVGLALTGAVHGAEKFTEMSQDAAISAAEQASRRTAEEIAANIANQGVGASLYQLFNPTGYSQELLNRANAGITKELRTYQDLINAQHGR